MSRSLIKKLVSLLSPSYLAWRHLVSCARFFRVNDGGQRTEEIILDFHGLPQSYMDSDGEERVVSRSDPHYP